MNDWLSVQLNHARLSKGSCESERLMKYTAILHEAEEGGFWATCAEVPEANGQGETQEEAIEDLKAAVELVLNYKRDHGKRIEPTHLREIDVA